MGLAETQKQYQPMYVDEDNRSERDGEVTLKADLVVKPKREDGE